MWACCGPESAEPRRRAHRHSLHPRRKSGRGPDRASGRRVRRAAGIGGTAVGDGARAGAAPRFRPRSAPVHRRPCGAAAAARDAPGGAARRDRADLGPLRQADARAAISRVGSAIQRLPLCRSRGVRVCPRTRDRGRRGSDSPDSRCRQDLGPLFFRARSGGVRRPRCQLASDGLRQLLDAQGSVSEGARWWPELSLDRVEVSLAPGAPATIVCVADTPGDGCGWRLASFTPAHGFVGAVVVEQWPQ